MRGLAARTAAMIRIEAAWLAVEPLNMRAGTETALARVVRVFGCARPHHAYLFANRRATRIKVLVHDGIGVWLAARRLNQGREVRHEDAPGLPVELLHDRFRAAAPGGVRWRPGIAFTLGAMKNIETLINEGGSISIGRLSPFGCVAAVADEHNSLAMLVRRDGETLSDEAAGQGNRSGMVRRSVHRRGQRTVRPSRRDRRVLTAGCRLMPVDPLIHIEAGQGA